MKIEKCNKCGGKIEQRVTRLVTKNRYEEKNLSLQTLVYLKCEGCNGFYYISGSDILHSLFKKEIVTVSKDFIEIIINELCHKKYLLQESNKEKQRDAQ
ncbi:MAG: hypothetical protein ACOWWO_09750 [Peptococcaceae bacterium]